MNVKYGFIYYENYQILLITKLPCVNHIIGKCNYGMAIHGGELDETKGTHLLMSKAAMYQIVGEKTNLTMRPILGEIIGENLKTTCDKK